jgi:hypothetical protein
MISRNFLWPRALVTVNPLEINRIDVLSADQFREHIDSEDFIVTGDDDRSDGHVVIAIHRRQYYHRELDGLKAATIAVWPKPSS